MYVVSPFLEGVWQKWCLSLYLTDIGVDHSGLLENENAPFEFVVMENALYAVSHKFNLNLSRMKQLFQILVDQNNHDPGQKTLERLFALKKTLMSFESRFNISYSFPSCQCILWNNWHEHYDNHSPSNLKILIYIISSLLKYAFQPVPLLLRDLNQRTLTIGGGITVQLPSCLTGLDLTNQVKLF